MKSPTRMSLLSAVMLASPVLSFAAGQHLIRVPSQQEMQDRTGVTRAVQSGKGTGVTREEGVRANAFRSETPQENQIAKGKPATGHSNWNDHALRK